MGKPVQGSNSSGNNGSNSNSNGNNNSNSQDNNGSEPSDNGDSGSNGNSDSNSNSASDGNSGSNGNSASNSNSGSDGNSGSNGNSASDSTSGSDGTSGSNGNSDSNSNSASDGNSGSNGNSASNSNSASDGSSGSNGNSGSNSNSASDSNSGSNGNNGSNGNSVSTGDSGSGPNSGPRSNKIKGTSGDDLLDGRETPEAKQITGEKGNDTIYGGDGDDFLLGNHGDDVIYAGPGNDTVHGNHGDDVITGGTGYDVIFGNAGIDTAIFSGDFEDYDLTIIHPDNVNDKGWFSGAVIVKDLKGDDGVDLLVHVESLQFADFTFNVNSAPVIGDDSKSSGAVTLGSGQTAFTVEQWTNYNGSLALADLQAHTGSVEPDYTITTDVIDFTDDPEGFAGDIPGSSPWPASGDQSAGTGGINDHFFARVTANIEITETDTYTFRTFNDDGVYLSVNNQLIIEDPTIAPETAFEGSLELESGIYPLELYFFEVGGEASLELSFKKGDSDFQLVGVSDKGTLTFSDVDITDRHTVTVEPVGDVQGSLIVTMDFDTNIETGEGGVVSWAYQIDSDAYPSLQDSVVESFNISVSDGKGGVAVQQVDITVTPPRANEGPSINFLDTSIDNGSFESGTTGWTVDQINYIGDWEAASGSKVLDMNAEHGGGFVEQSLETVVGAQYTVAFALSKNPGSSSETLQVSAAGTIQDYTFDLSNSTVNMAWSQQTFTFTATEETSILRLASADATGGDDAWGPALDDVRLVGQLSAFEDTLTTIKGLSVSDSDAGPNPIKLELSVDNGSLSISGTGLSGDDLDGSDGTLSVTGSLADLNAALLDGLVYLSDQDYFGADSLSVTVNDQGYTGAGGAASDSESIAINVVPVGDTFTPSNLITDGSFESYSVGGAWAVTKGDIDVVDFWSAGDGDYSVDLNGFVAGELSQTIDTVAEQTYSVGFLLALNPHGAHLDSATVKVSAAGTSQEYTFTDSETNSGTNMEWSQQTFTFTAASLTTDTTLSFESLTSGSDAADGPTLDEVVVVSNLIVPNFIPGPGGDVLNLNPLLDSIAAPHDGSAFTDGFLIFEQSGSDTLVRIDSNGLESGSNYLTAVTLVGVVPADLDISNYTL